MKLDKKEQEIENSIEKGEWISVRNLKKEMTRHQKIAENTLKDTRINLRISHNDLLGIKKEASNDGIPYQTWIRRILHKYLNGTLGT